MDKIRPVEQIGDGCINVLIRCFCQVSLVVEIEIFAPVGSMVVQIGILTGLKMKHIMLLICPVN